MKIVQIKWLDICHGTPNWAYLDSLEVSPLTAVSVGMVVRETDDFISIAQSYSEETGLIADTLTIPKSVVKEIVELGLID